MPILFFLKKLLSAALLPPLLPLLILVLGLLLRKRRAGSYLCWLALALLVFFSTPATVGLIALPLEQQFAVATAEQVLQTQAVVILAGGKRGYAPEFGGSTPNRLTLERLRYGALLARRSSLPILVSGGAPEGQKPEAELMALALKDDFGLPTRWIESGSLDTHDNAVLSAQILKAAGIERITLVTHAMHMQRAVNEFTVQGIEVLPAPTAFLMGSVFGAEVFRYIPNISSVYGGWYAAHEWAGLGAQWLKLRFG